MKGKVTVVTVNGDQYLVLKDLGEVLLLKKGEYHSLFFHNYDILIPCGTKNCSSGLKVQGNRMYFGTLVLPVREWNISNNVVEYIISLSCGDFLFKTTRDGNLLFVQSK